MHIFNKGKLSLNSCEHHEVILVIPVYNEQECISLVVEDWTQVLASLDINYKILLINDGSSDNTPTILDEIHNKNKRVEVVHQKNSGHGATILRGYSLALELNAQWIFQVDSDNQFNPKDFINLWQLKNKQSVLQGVRQNRHDPLHRLIISKCLKTLIYLTHFVSIRDANCPYRLYPASLLKQFLRVIPTDSFAPNIFLSILSANTKTLREISIEHRNRETGTVSIIRLNLIKACLTSLKQFFNIRKSIQNFKLITLCEPKNSKEEKRNVA